MSNPFESDDSKGFFCYSGSMKNKTLLVLFLSFLFTACLSTFVVKNRATVLSAEKFDNEVIAASKDNFVDLEQQKVFADFIKKNSRMVIDNVEVKDDTATADLTIISPARILYAEFKTISGKEWQAKADANMESRSFRLNLKKTNDSWQIVDQTETPKK
jgi:hypothetical protein